MPSKALSAILQNPDDDRARQVYADELLDAGDPRGEFIQLQCLLGGRVDAKGDAWPLRDEDDPDIAKRCKRERALLKAHQKTWLGPFRAVVRTWHWSRGFVESATADAKQFLAGARTLFEHTPLRALQLTAMKPDTFAKLSALPHMQRVRSLDLTGQRLDAASAMHLHSVNWASLRSLVLNGNQLGLEGMQAIAESPALAGLTSFSLSDGALTDDVVDVLLRARFFKSLEVLELGWNSLTLRSVERIAASGKRLTQLSLQGMELGDAGARALAAGRALKKLTRLDLDVQVTRAGVNALLESPHLKRLREIDGLSANGVGLYAIEALEKR